MIAMAQLVSVKKIVPSGTVILDWPERRNPLSRDVVSKLLEAFSDFHQERSVRAVILTGAGNTFCSGTDLRELQETADEELAPQMWQDDVEQLLELIEVMLRFPKPLIAAVNGWVVGNGVALMLATDLVIAGRGARLALPEARRGLVAGLTMPLLAFRVGAGLAARLTLGTEELDAATCLQWGLFHELVDDQLVWARAHERASELAAGAGPAHQLAKQLLNETIGESLFAQLSIGAANMAAARTTDAAKEGVRAFLEKRSPKF
jgi:enoyl-CoA hydratase/carnithine racemase